MGICTGLTHGQSQTCVTELIMMFDQGHYELTCKAESEIVFILRVILLMCLMISELIYIDGGLSAKTVSTFLCIF